MNVLNALKGLFKGKGGTDVDDFNITDSAVSSTMRSATSLWWDAFQGQLPFAQTHKNFKPLPTAYVSTAYLAQLVTGEIKFEVADEELNKHVQKNLLPNLDRIVQQTLVGGYTVIKPYFVQSGEMFFDSGTSRDFLPMALDENGHITEGVFFERIRYRGKIYERREHHTFQNGVHTVRNTAYLYGTKHAVELATVPKWAVLLPEGRILSDIPMIATFRTPYANNIDLDSELPISIFANSLGTLHEIDEAHSEYCAEFKKMSAKGIPDDYFVGISGDGTSTMEQQIMAYAPQIRETEHSAKINKELRFYETQIGVSSGTFSFDTQKGLVTATQVLSEDRTTYNTVCQIQRQLRPVLQSLSQIIVTLARFYGVECEDGECAIEFGDSVFEDTGTEFNRRFQMVQAGLLKPELFVSWYYGVPVERALEMISPMTELFGGE
jgi:hypothetical protein